MEAISKPKVVPVDKICYTDLTTEKEYCEDAHYDAIHNVVLFAFSHWGGLACKEKLLLSAHEFLRVAGLETEDYSYSGRFLDNSVVQCSGSDHASELRCADDFARMERSVSKFCEYLRMWAEERSHSNPQ